MKRLALAVGVVIFPFSGIAPATDTTTTMAVSALVVDVCAVVALPLAFGTYDPTSSSNLDATSTVTVTCSLNTPYNVKLNPGATGGATVTARKLLNGATQLPYGLYRDASHAQNWGETIGTDTKSGTGSGLPQAITVYGRIAGSGNVQAGTYTDTVTVTVTY